MRKNDISITICTLGLVNTENVITAVEEFRPALLSMIPKANPSETALSVIKGGAQRWNNVNYPKEILVTTLLYHLIPETFAALARYIWS